MFWFVICTKYQCVMFSHFNHFFPSYTSSCWFKWKLQQGCRWWRTFVWKCVSHMLMEALPQVPVWLNGNVTENCVTINIYFDDSYNCLVWFGYEFLSSSSSLHFLLCLNHWELSMVLHFIPYEETIWGSLKSYKPLTSQSEWASMSFLCTHD